ncbi:MAG: hypothetical protein HN580_05335 [Deltaproteobacteria bacterium]|nr:hypothetical protein [Deltaproteobacteria bacterium]
MMRYSSKLGIALLILMLLALVAVADYHRQRAEYADIILMRQALQKAVGLTDLSITTAARYLRHYSLGDLTTPFQDYPASLDHFPAGFVYTPPDVSDVPKPIKFGPLPTPNEGK